MKKRLSALLLPQPHLFPSLKLQCDDDAVGNFIQASNNLIICAKNQVNPDLKLRPLDDNPYRGLARGKLETDQKTVICF